MTFTDVIANPPATLAEWDAINKTEHNLHHKWPRRIRQMYRMHKAKALRANEEYQSHVDHPGYYRKLLMDGGISLEEANAQIIIDKAYWNRKRKHLRSIVKCCRVEYEIRLLLIADGRHPVEPDEADTMDEAELPGESDTITSIDLSIVRNPIG